MRTAGSRYKVHVHKVVWPTRNLIRNTPVTAGGRKYRTLTTVDFGIEGLDVPCPPRFAVLGALGRRARSLARPGRR